MAKNKISGQDAFDEYYKNLFPSRWEFLKENLLKEKSYFEFKYENCKGYFLDSASVMASICLPLENAKNILDLCAAPGGKSLVLASRMNENAHLICNERSSERRNRLISVLNESLPQNIRKRIKVTGIDGSFLAKKLTENQNETFFDAILLDAPCSTERYVLANPKYLAKWTSARIKNLSFTQWSLLSSSFLALKKSGFLLYSTCALSNIENDEVVKRLFKKYGNVKLIEINFASVLSSIPDFLRINSLNIEKTALGYQIFPDKNAGSGPIYFSLIQKI